MSKDFLELLLEGNSSNEDNIETDDAVDKEIEESYLPMGTLIESVFTTTQMEINAAMELYEMACIVGGVQVVSEGMDREGATEILTEASNGFFAKIKETIIKIKKWFMSLIQKITGKFKSIGKDTATKFKAMEGDFDKAFESGKFKYKGSIIDIKKLDDILAAPTAALNEMVEDINDELNQTSPDDTEKNLEAVKDDEDMKRFISDPLGVYYENLANANPILKGAKNQAEVVDKCKEAMGYEPDGGKEIKVTSAEVTKMKEVINFTAKDSCDKEKEMVKTVNEMCDKLIEKMNAFGADGNHPLTTKVFSAEATMINECSHLFASVINMKIQVATAAASSYLGWMKQVANGKGVTEGADYVEEGFDTLYLFEAADINDVIAEGMDPMLEFFEWTNVKAVKEFFSGKKKEAHRLTKDANKAFKAGQYKEAKEKYKKALPIWKEILKNIANVPEKAPGIFSSNDWPLFIPYLNLPLMLCLTYATISPMRYVPKGQDFFDKERISKKVKEITRTGSVSKKTLLEAIETVVDYIEFQIKACDKPTGIVLEDMDVSGTIEALNDVLESIAEAVEEEDDIDFDDDDDELAENVDLCDLAMSFLQ